MQKKQVKKKRSNQSKSRQKAKRLKTFNESDFSLFDQTNLMGDVLKNEAFKKRSYQNTSQINFNSTINNYTSVYTVISNLADKTAKVKSTRNNKNPSSQSNLINQTSEINFQKKKVHKSKSKSKIVNHKQKKKEKEKQKQKQKLQPYEYIPPSKNSLNSEIVFSNQDTKRQSEQGATKQYIGCYQKGRESLNITQKQKNLQNNKQLYNENQNQLLVTKNRLLSLNIKKEYKKKTEAATKIQKVFRGYLTRKILQKYIRKQQQKLNELLNEYKMSSQSQYRSHRSNQFFSSHNHTSKTFQDEQSINLSKINPSQFKLVEESKKLSSSERQSYYRNESKNQNEILNCQDDINSSDIQDEQKNQQNQEANSNSSEGDEEFAVYRHQQRIYSQSQIQQFLQSSSDEEDQYENQIQDNINLAKLSNHVIMETNEEHIESRKSSILHNQQKNKLFSGKLSDNHCENINVGDVRNIEVENDEEKNFDLIKTSKLSHSISQGRDYEDYSSKNSKRSRIQQGSYHPESSSEEKLKSNQKTSKKQCKKSKVDKSYNIKISGQQQSSDSIEEFQVSDLKKHNKTKKNQRNIDIIEQNVEPLMKKNVNHEDKLLNEINKRQQKSSKVIYYFSDSDHNQSETTMNNRKNEQLIKSPTKKSQNSSGKKIERLSSSRSKRSEPGNKNQQFERLKNLQMKKWQQVISLISSQMQRNSPQNKKDTIFNKTINYHSHNQNNSEYEEFIKQIMQLSLKNKQILSNFKKNRNENNLINSDGQEWKDLRDSISMKTSKRSSVTEHDISIFKPNLTSRMIVCNIQGNENQTKNHNASFFREPKQQLKQKINKLQEQTIQYHNKQNCPQNIKRLKEYQNLISNFQTDHIENMLMIREELLQKRQCEQLTKLNEKLIRKQITQKQFLSQLTKLTEIFNKEKDNIDKVREDINKGYKAAIKLIQDSLVQGKKIGYKLPISRSSDSYKLSKNLFGYNLFNGGFNSIIIDEFQQRSNNLQQCQHNNDKDYLKAKQKQNNSISKQDEMSKQKKFEKSQNLPIKKQQNFQHQQSFQSNPNSSSSFKEFRNNFFGSFESKEDKHLRSPDILNQIFDNSNKKSKINDIIDSPSEFDNFDENFSQQSSQIYFSEDQLRRFRKTQPFDMQIADMNRNLMIGTDFFKTQRQSIDKQDLINENINEDIKKTVIKLHREVYQIQEQESLEFINPYANRHNSSVDLITEKEMEYLILEVSLQIMMKPLFAEKYLFKKRQEMFGLRKITNETRKQFISIVKQLLPSDNVLLNKLNQNISPLPKQLLKCMRIDFSEQDYTQENDEEYEQIGKYEMILDQQVCNAAIQKYKEKLQKQKQDREYLKSLTQESLQDIVNEFPFLEEKNLNFLNQRQKFVTNRKEHCDSIKWEFINMELHTVFDSWNQQIIEMKANKAGFSGIGLNELTMSMIDRNSKVKAEQVKDLLQESRFKVMKMLGFENDIMKELNFGVMNRVKGLNSNQIAQQFRKSAQKYSQICKTQQYQEYLDYCEDSKWVFYSDQALSYGLELVYLIQEELFSQMAKQLRKRSLQLKMN